MKKKDTRREAGLSPARTYAIRFLRTLLLLIVLAMGSSVGFLYLFGRDGPSASDKIIVIEPGTSALAIGMILENEGLIHNRHLFGVGISVYGYRNQLKAGEYVVPRRASPFDIMRLLSSGETLDYKLVIPEGFTNAQVEKRINALDFLTGEIEQMPHEGYLFPATLTLKRGASRQSAINTLTQTQERVAQKIWDKRAPNLPLNSLHELITLASIVEKEAGRNDDRARIAAVFINRLRKGMRLQSDPTVYYAVTNGVVTDRKLYRSDFSLDDPYNTYRRSGLPPGPVCNPGIDSLRAASQPLETDELYFVARNHEESIFAKTFDEHQKNVATWYRRD